MEIKKAGLADLSNIMPIYDRARAYMAQNGNATQWTGGYPAETDIAADIQAGNCYICTEQGQIHAVFALIFGEDPTYRTIEEGAWLTDEPYATIHRMASAGLLPGMAYQCFAWCERLCSSRGFGLRIDTHADNKVMQHAIEDFGFQKRGIIRLQNGSPRMAYQKLWQVKTVARWQKKCL